MASTSRRTAGLHEDVLAQYDENDSAPVIDESEQQQVIDQIRLANEKSNYWYRAALLLIYALVVVLYLTPVPAYAMGKHPKSHMTIFLHHHHTVGTEDDLTYLPAFPIYASIASLLIYLMFLASYELADRLSLVAPQEFAFPRQPHPFGTAPWWIVPVLRDIRLAPSRSERKKAADKAPQKAELAKVLPPRIVYIGFVWVCSWPIPLMTFGLGAFDDALWWSFPFAAFTIHVLIEWWMYKADRNTLGLQGLKYNYKTA